VTRALVLLRRRLAQAIPTLLIVLVADFLLLRLAPGDVVDVLMIAQGGGDPAIAAGLRAEYGLDQPWPLQLALYLGKMARLDLGYSFFYNQRVATLILERLPTTLLLMGASIGFAFALGTLMGAAAALRAGSWRDTAIVSLGMLLTAMPGFWIGLMLIVAFAVKLAWLPVGGISTPASGLTGIDHALDVASHLVLPTATLSLIFAAIYMRLMRAGMIEAYGQDFVRTARAKGLSRWQVATRHVARHALLPVVTMLGLQAATVLGGSVVVETVFSLPGIGRLAYDAVLQRDVNTLLGIVFVSALVVIAVNALVDLAYAWIDPRIAAR
jgi:peptide/nickel transport system permease protein